MSKSIKLKDNNYIDSSSIVHGSNHYKLNNFIADLPYTYQKKIRRGRDAWKGTYNKINLPETYYGYYLIFNMSSQINSYNVYLLRVNGTALNAEKLLGTFDVTFSISGSELTITMPSSNYWISFALYLGTAGEGI